MTIPDGLVYAALPTMGVTVVWAARQFVQWSNENRVSADDDGGMMSRMTIRDGEVIVKHIEKYFNGRYMFAEESRKLFARLDEKMGEFDEKISEIRIMLARYVDCDCERCQRHK